MGRIDRPLRAAVVCDAGPLIHLDELGCFDLLTDFPEVWLPNEVVAEVHRHRPSALHPTGLSFRSPQPAPDLTPDLAVLARALSLGAGETAGLAFAASHPALVYLTDDAAARLAARALRLRSYGSLGVLVRSIRRRLRSASEVAALLRSLPTRSTLYLRRDLLDEVLREVESLPP